MFGFNFFEKPTRPVTASNGFFYQALPSFSRKKMLFTGLGRSGFGRNSALGLEYRSQLTISRLRALFLPIRTSGLVNNIYIFVFTVWKCQLCPAKMDASIIKIVQSILRLWWILLLYMLSNFVTSIKIAIKKKKQFKTTFFLISQTWYGFCCHGYLIKIY